MTDTTFTAEEIAALLHLVSYNARLRDAGSPDALCEEPGQMSAFRKLFALGGAAGVDIEQYN